MKLNKKLWRELRNDGIDIECKYQGSCGGGKCAYAGWEENLDLSFEAVDGYVPMRNENFKWEMIKVRMLSRGKMYYRMYKNGYSNRYGVEEIRKPGIEVELLEGHGFYYAKGDIMHIKTKFFSKNNEMIIEGKE